MARFGNGGSAIKEKEPSQESFSLKYFGFMIQCLLRSSNFLN